MYNVIMADDEIGVRNGLKLKINWEEQGMRLVGEASNGKEALALLEKHDIHILITDIRMPIVDGIALLKECAVHYPDLKVVVLSGYDDFAFVKTAIQCGAKDYLLKPVIRSELLSLLDKLKDELDEERIQRSNLNTVNWKLQQNMPVLREQLLLELIYEEPPLTPAIQDKIRQLHMDSLLEDRQHKRCLCFEMRIPPNRMDTSGGNPELLKSAFQMVCRELSEEWSPKAYAFHDWMHASMMYVLLDEADMPSTKRFVQHLQEAVKQYLRVETVVGVGEPFQAFSQLRAGYLSCVYSWNLSRPGADSQVIFAETSQDTAKEFPPDLEKRLFSAIDLLDIEAFTGFLKQVFPSSGHSMKTFTLFVLRVGMLLDYAAKKNEVGIKSEFLWTRPDLLAKLNTSAQAVEHFAAFAAVLINTLKSRKTTGGAEITEAVRKYIDDNYASELSLTLLAERFSISHTYLSDQFKKHVGETFSDYLVRVRLSRAEQLLKESPLKLADIAELVGFASPNYFSSVFKKHFGVSPNDYRFKAPTS